MKPFCNELCCEKLHDLQIDVQRAQAEIKRLTAANVQLQKDKERLRKSNLEYERQYAALKRKMEHLEN